MQLVEKWLRYGTKHCPLLSSSYFKNVGYNLTLFPKGLKYSLSCKGRWIPPYFFLANCSVHRPPTEMVLYLLERPCPCNFKKYKTEMILYFLTLSGQYYFRDYWTILVGFLCAEQCVIKIRVIFRKINKSVRTLI